MAEKIPKHLQKKRGPKPKPKGIPGSFGQEYVQPGDNTKYLEHALAIQQMPEINIADIDQVEKRIYEYYALCAKNDMKPTVMGFCNSLGINRTTLFDWRRGKFRADTHQAVICKAYGMLEELWESYMQNGKINPVSGIFLGKNNFGYQDKQEYVLTPNQQNEIDPTVIEAKYEELPE